MSEITQFQILNDEWVRYGDHLVEVERLTAERDEARAEVERLKEQVATLTVGMEWADKLKAYAEAAEAETDRVVADGNKALAEVERLTGERDAALAEVQRLTAERDTAQAEVELLTRAREALRDSLREALIERNDARYEAGQLRREQKRQRYLGVQL
jgi:chromosome segregation ATPase